MSIEGGLRGQYSVIIIILVSVQNEDDVDNLWISWIEYIFVNEALEVSFFLTLIIVMDPHPTIFNSNFVDFIQFLN